MHNKLKAIISKEQHNLIFKNIRKKGDKITSYTLLGYFIFGLCIAPIYNTWIIGIGVGLLNLISYYTSKILLPQSTLNQYVASAVYAVFMAQFIYQMHGLFEMHFWVFIGCTLLIVYQNWKLHLPLVSIVIIHHGLFAYLQFTGNEEIYFTQLNFMDLNTFLIHIFLANIIFLICGYWSFDNYNKTLAMAYQNIKIKNQRDEILSKSEKLKDANKTVQQTNLNLEEIVTKRTEELILAKEELNLFLYRTSHDLRGPLARIEGLLELAKIENVQSVYWNECNTVVGEMAKTLEKLLMISTISNKSSECQLITFEKLKDFVTKEFSHYDANINFQYQTDVTTFYSKPTLIKLILKALVENAIIFNYQKPEVNVEIFLGEDNILSIYVTDNGIGIEEKDMSHLFDMFFKASNKSKGNGLGLFIVKQAIKELNGEIDVNSKITKGTKFKIIIPVEVKQNQLNNMSA
ncbi:sensor histidine kinase [Chondrinema litorale]|uniref:sensor histidine kinase n=1 Tax=Chondrinema litorale TaxID=2994555 RepID=UPI002543BF36|nr:HAMP domain-containing sensor histidine kinase [Chondrinema litorale]UZR97942.1 HAMP domain-containing sensor histidine kinase [Chondrinema litorale]